MRKLMKTLGLVGLVVAAGTVAALLLTGRLHVDWSGTHGASKGAEEGHGGHEEHEEGRSHVVGGKIVLDEEAFRASGIRTAPAAVGSVALTLRVTGEIHLAEDRLAHVTPRIPGAIRSVERTLGDRVAPGEALCTIESVELGEARASHVSAHSELILAERNYARWKELFEKGLRTQNELWAAENELTRARIRHEAATGKLKALGIHDDEIAALETSTLSNRYTVVSPVGGSVLERHATLGENVEAKDVMFLVADLSEVWVQAAIYEKDLASVRKGMAAVVRIQAYPELPFPGRVTYVGQKVDERSRTVPLRIAVKNGPAPGGDEPFTLRPGMFATVDLETARREDVVVVPVAAVQTVGGETAVFVREAKKGVVFERRVVTTGERDADNVEVVKGLKAGEEVVVENAFLLKSELEKSRIGEGHAH